MVIYFENARHSKLTNHRFNVFPIITRAEIYHSTQAPAGRRDVTINSYPPLKGGRARPGKLWLLGEKKYLERRFLGFEYFYYLSSQYHDRASLSSLWTTFTETILTL